jgi:cytochrome c oxidase cbb3-type subunit 2
LQERDLDGAAVQTKMRALRKIGVPYSDADIASAPEAVAGRNELDALVAYLQSMKFPSESSAARGQP